MEEKLLNIFRVKTLSELLFAIFVIVFSAVVIVTGKMAFHNRYHYFPIDYDNDGVYIEEIGNKKLFIYKSTDPVSTYPRIHYKITERNETIEESTVFMGIFEIFPSFIIFENDENNTVSYVDQYINENLLPKNLSVDLNDSRNK